MKSIFALFVTAAFLPGAGADEIRPAEQIWFDAPATMWEEALPVGSGTLGVMVFGGVEKARYSFNEDTLWTGHPTAPSAAFPREGRKSGSPSTSFSPPATASNRGHGPSAMPAAT